MSVDKGITCAHCSCDMSKQKLHERCSNDGLCVSIEEFDDAKLNILLAACGDILEIAYHNGRGGLVEFRPHEFDDLKQSADWFFLRRSNKQ